MDIPAYRVLTEPLEDIITDISKSELQIRQW